MATPHQQQIIKQWLDKVLSPYPSSDHISRESLAALARFPTLSIKTEAYTYDSGQTQLLLQLHGTIPITFKSQTYHIPITTWFPLEYPRRPPMVYVTPTRDMAIRKSEEVEPGGRVGGSMLGMWERKWEGNSLDALLSWMQDLFSAQPPVYSRPPAPAPGSATSASTSSVTAPRPSTPSQPPPRPAPPRIMTGNGNYGLQPPAVPVRPRSLVMPGIDSGVAASPRSSEQLPEYRPAPQQPPPLPASPLRQGPPQMFPPNIPGSSTPPARPGPPTIAGRPASGYATPPRSNSYLPPGGQQPMSPSRTDFVPGQSIRQQSLPPPLHSGMTQNEFYGQAQGYEHGRIASPGPALVPQPRTAPRPPIRDLMADDDDDLTPSVSTSTVEASGSIPPSRPLPPATLHLHSLVLSHLSSQYTPLMEHLNSQTSQLLNIQADLSSGEPAIKDEMARLEAVRDVCVSVVDKVGGVVVAAEERVRDLERRGEVGVDEVVCSISIVHNQLIDLVAEDNAIEDTIYHLARALDADRIDLNTFLKQTRTLAREQYQKRALIEKIQGELNKGIPADR